MNFFFFRIGNIVFVKLCPLSIYHILRWCNLDVWRNLQRLSCAFDKVSPEAPEGCILLRFDYRYGFGSPENIHRQRQREAIMVKRAKELQGRGAVRERILWSEEWLRFARIHRSTKAFGRRGRQNVIRFSRINKHANRAQKVALSN